jgi:hypothetical protein
VIFNVFSDDDRQTYAAALEGRTYHAAIDRSTSIDRIADWLERSPRVMIGAGAVLSVAAGLDYTDEESFARHYPGLRRRGFRACYELIGQHDLPGPLFWGYWAVHVKLARFTPHVAPVYEALYRICADKDVFVMTSNVEGLFTRHGFEADRIWTVGSPRFEPRANKR